MALANSDLTDKLRIDNLSATSVRADVLVAQTVISEVSLGMSRWNTEAQSRHGWDCPKQSHQRGQDAQSQTQLDFIQSRCIANCMAQAGKQCVRDSYDLVFGRRSEKIGWVVVRKNPSTVRPKHHVTTRNVRC